MVLLIRFTRFSCVVSFRARYGISRRTIRLWDAQSFRLFMPLVQGPACTGVVPTNVASMSRERSRPIGDGAE